MEARATTVVAAVLTAAVVVVTADPASASCDKFASPRKSNVVAKLANSLRPGQTGCLRAGVYRGRIKIRKGGRAGAPTTIRSAPGARATVRGRLWVANSANHVVVKGLYLDGRNGARLPSPTVNGNRVVFRDNDITTRNTTICFVLGSDEYGRAVRTVIERNRIHNCGRRPPTNHHHGIYAEATDGTRIIDNWIYDNADRGVQLFPDAQRTYIARNVIDGNGEGIVFARRSARNVIEHNVIANSIVRYNVEDFELRGAGNVVRRNCLWSPIFGGIALTSPGIGVELLDNLVAEPEYLDREGKDFRLPPASPCFSFSPGSWRPGPR